MAYKELENIFKNLQERVNKQDFSINSVNNLLFEILEENHAKFEEFKNDIQLKWEDFERINRNRVIKKTFTYFFYENFQEMFRYFLNVFFGFDKNSLKLLSKEKISEEIIFFDYSYTLNSNEEDIFIKNSAELHGDALYGFSLTTGYLYFLIRLLGIVIRKIIQKKIFFFLFDVTMVILIY